MNGGESRVNSRHEHSYTTTNNYLLQINCSLTLSHTHTHLRTQKVEETMYGAKPHQHQSLHHTGRRGGGTPAGGQGEQRRIDIPILPCLLHWPPTLSHIIAADTEKTNDSHVGNMGPGGKEREGSDEGLLWGWWDTRWTVRPLRQRWQWRRLFQTCAAGGKKI